MKSFWLILAVWFGECSAAGLGKLKPKIRDTRIKVFAYTTIVEHKVEPEFHFGDTKAFLHCSITNITGERLGTAVQWFKDGIPVSKLKNGNHFIARDNDTLEIDLPKRSDAGVYVARFKLKKNPDLSTYDCHVTYYAKPLILDFLPSINVDEDQQLKIACKIKGYPISTVTWYREGASLPLGRNNSHIQFFPMDGVDNAHLIIQQMKRSDQGVYKCVAYSAYFNYSDSKQLIIRVNDKLAALWPLLGILVSGVILFLFIVTFEVNAKTRIKKEEALLYSQSFHDLSVRHSS